MRGVVSARCPHKKDDPCAPHAKALKPQFAVVLAVILHRDHGRVEDRFKVCKIDSMPSEIFTAFRLVPGDHEQNVYAGYASVKQIVDADEGGRVFRWPPFEFSGRRRQSAGMKGSASSSLRTMACFRDWNARARG